MALTPGTRLGVYEVTAQIGEGGMGQVFRARDTKLDRDVAIKILPEAFAHDADRLARFQREAKTLASLNHPHIAAIYGLEESGGVSALVMELVEGDDLSQRIAHGAIPLDEALPIAKQIAEALEAAHEQGIIHRDLKPANIKITRDGNVKVLDFGLAKALDTPVASNPNATQSPTITTPAIMTGIGTILGTAAYMSPEQAKGRPADKRSDMWAFGCVLYEMLTGKRAFTGDDVSEALASVLRSEPDWTALPIHTPPSIRRLLRRSLEKDRKERVADASVARLEIKEALSGSQVDAPVTPRALRTRERFVWISLVAVVATGATAAMMRTFRPVSSAPEMRLEITTPSTTDPVSLAISPDGQTIVFVATDQGQSKLWLRPLAAVTARPLAGTDGGSFPFWSPDNRSVGFFADNKLKRIDIDGGAVLTLTTATINRGGAWNRDGVILFTPTSNNSIFRISATGGEPIAVTRLESNQSAHRAPQFLPDGRHFLYQASGGPATRGVFVGQLDGSETQRLFDADAGAVYAASGQAVLFVRQGTLFAQNFDPVRLALLGNPYPITGQVRVDGASAFAPLSASAAGPIVYRAGSAGTGQRQFVWFDRSGKEIEQIGSPDSAGPTDPAMSPDGRRVALRRTVNGNPDIWLLDLGRGVLSRFTFDAAGDTEPLWSPDGSRIVFASNRRTGKVFDLYLKQVTGATSEEPLLATEHNLAPMDWSPDGRFLLCRTVIDPKRSFDLLALPLEGNRKTFPVVQTNFDERDGQFSPDGKWIAYQSDESGRFEIYVQLFPGPGGKFQVSTNGGAQVRWRRDGRELFYIALDGRLMAVSIQLASNGQGVEAGSPVPLFATHVGNAVQSNNRQQYMVSPDGQRFLMNTVTEEATSPITVIVNWKAKS